MRLAVVFAFVCALTASPNPVLADEGIMVELFTSQGCSSCPPADRLLSELGSEDDEVDIIPLSFHVDYWNSIGWKDAFSSPKWSKRQRAYASVISDRTYTPQLVVQGEIDCVGSHESCIRGALDRVRTRPAAGSVRIDEAREIAGSVFVDAVAELREGQPRAVATVVVYESGLSTDVRRGENRGRELRNDFVVRALTEVETIRPGDTEAVRVTTRIPLQQEWRTDNLGVVVFLQEPRSRRILVAARSPLEAKSAELKMLPPPERVPLEQVALGGHCPVTLAETGSLVPGSPNLQYRYQGCVYQLSNLQAATKFARQPARYVSSLSTFDPWVHSETRQRTTGALHVFSVYDRRPWFFLNTDNKKRSLFRPDPYVQGAFAR